MGVTINTPGPIDPTFINTIRNKVTRCSDCDQRAIWILSPEALKAKGRKENSQMVWVGYIFGVIFGGMAIYFWLTWPFEFDLTIGLVIGALVLFSFLSFVAGISSAQMKKAYLRQDQEK
jgi:threonine/homoserine/homoserine lactone efflux protein